MAIAVKCQCGRSFKAKDEHAGLRANCPNCGVVLDIPKGTHASSPSSYNGYEAADVMSESQMANTLEEIKALLADMTQLLLLQAKEAAPTTASAGGQRQYKVLTQKDKWFSGKFDPERLEQAVNAYAGQGWTVKGITTASIPGFGGNRDELIVLMER